MLKRPTRKQQGALVVVTILALVGALYAGLELRPQHSPAATTPAAAQPAAALERHAALPRGELARGVVAHTASQATPTSRELLTKFSAGNWREVVHYGLQHPEEGGYYYANHVLGQCLLLARTTNVLTSPELDPKDDEGKEPIDPALAPHEKRMKAFRSLKRFCSDFTAAEYADVRLSQIGRHAREKGDPLYMASLSFSGITYGDKGLQSRRVALLKALEALDPLVFDELGWKLAMYRNETLGTHFWFRGETYTLNDHPDIGHVFYLLPCGLGLQCDANEFKTAMTCASGHACDASRFDAVKRQMASKGPQAYESLMKVYDQFLQAARARDVGAWIKPEGR